MPTSNDDIRISNQKIFEKLTPADVEFFERISRRVTGSSAIPFDLPANSVFDIIVRSLKWFWEWYPSATQEKLLFLPYSEICKYRNESSALNIDIKMPNGIEAIYDWKAVDQYRIGGVNMVNYMSYALLSNYSIGGFMNNYGYSQRGAYAQNPISMVNVVTALYEVEQYKETFTRGYRATFNKNSQIFRLTTEVNTSFVINCFVRLEPEFMYNDYKFEDYVVACVNEQIGKILNTFGFKLPGDVQLNYEQIKEEGKETRKEIEEEIKGMNNTDFIQFKTS